MTSWLALIWIAAVDLLLFDNGVVHYEAVEGHAMATQATQQGETASKLRLSLHPSGKYLLGQCTDAIAAHPKREDEKTIRSNHGGWHYEPW